jgi:hypothetical protein
MENSIRKSDSIPPRQFEASISMEIHGKKGGTAFFGEFFGCTFLVRLQFLHFVTFFKGQLQFVTIMKNAPGDDRLVTPCVTPVNLVI